MSVSLKPLSQQVIFITGASSGVGMAVVKSAVEQGAKVFMVAHHEGELQKMQDEMRLRDLPTAFAVADVTEVDQLQVAADQCLATFGTIDTWINCASVPLYARILETNDEEARRLFDANFWGVVNGSKVAASMLKHTGGAIINIGGSCNQKNLPLQAVYCASKEAVKSFTSSLRDELHSEKYPVSVSLVLPEVSDRVYLPELVAETILKCATVATRELSIKQKFKLPDFKKYIPHIMSKRDPKNEETLN